MDNSGRAYQELLRRIRDELPEVAAQIEDEVARGRRVTGEALAKPDRDERGERMKPTGSRISKEDLIWLPYSDDQQLGLLVTAVLRTLSTATTSRAALAGLLNRNDLQEVVEFADEGSADAAAEIDVGAEAVIAQQALEIVRADLEEALEELT